MYWYRGALGPARVAFTDRTLGNVALHVDDDPQAVRSRRLRLEESMGVEAGSLLFLNQVHGVDVAQADDPRLEPVPTADAAVSRHGRPLAVMVADCVPVVLVGTDPEEADTCVTGVAHAGRQGFLGGVLEATIAAMQELGAVKIQAMVGPSVCGNCYEVPEQMASDSEHQVAGVRGVTSWGTPSLDLPTSARRSLVRMGVTVSEPDAGGSCTLENHNLSSHRRDPSSGRIAGVVWV